MKEDAALKTYFTEVASWERDKERDARRALRWVSWAAGLGWLTAIAVAVALMLLMPLKRVEPFVIRVDNSTGIVDVVPVGVGTSSTSEAVTRYFLAHYVRTCERFNYATAEADYEECAALNAPARNQIWAARWARSNPDSPLNLYTDGTTIRAQVKSVSFFARASGEQDLAQVRYVLGTRRADTALEAQTHWIATLQYAYTEPPSEPRYRRWNPLGFKVLDFKPEPETPPNRPEGSEPLAALSRAGAAP